MSKTTYWISNANGQHAQVEGVEERDKWTPLGWTVEEHPPPGAFVYMNHDGIEEAALFAYEAMATWEQMGWTACSPPKPVDVTKDPKLFDQPAAEPEKKSAPKSDKSATAAAKNETE